MESRNCYNSGMRACVRIGLLVLLACFSASGSDYFPLAIGHQWVYRITGGGLSAIVVEVLSARVDGNKTYFLVMDSSLKMCGYARTAMVMFSGSHRSSGL